MKLKLYMIVLLIGAGLLLSSCHTTRKPYRPVKKTKRKDCDCPEWSQKLKQHHLKPYILTTDMALA